MGQKAVAALSQVHLAGPAGRRVNDVAGGLDAVLRPVEQRRHGVVDAPVSGVPYSGVSKLMVYVDPWARPTVSSSKAAPATHTCDLNTDSIPCPPDVLRTFFDPVTRPARYDVQRGEGITDE